MADKKYEIDMCSGPLLPKMLRFAFPLMLSGVLQLLFNAADVIVVGRFSGKEALAAVGSTGALINMIINVFMGLSVGVNVLVARYIGAKDDHNVSQTVHTAIAVAAVCGLIMAFVGNWVCRPLLIMMSSPADVLDKATLYMRIYFIGVPGVMLYNFGAAVLRAVGDTRRPLVYLTVAGVINVVCNLFFVIALDWDVAGVAAATAISQGISAFLVLRCLARTEGSYQLHWKQMKIHGEKFMKILRGGLPAGIQGAVFSLSNVVIQSSVNSFGSVVMAGNAAASNIEGFIWTSMNSIYQANVSFTSQNMGARKYSRINRITLLSLGCVVTVGLALGLTGTVFGRQLLGIYNPDPEVIAFGIKRMIRVGMFSFVGGMMDVMVGSMRGIGYSVLPTVISLTGACGMRVLWCMTVFRADPRLEVLFFIYPLSWIVTAFCHILCFVLARRKIPKEDEAVPVRQF